MPHAVCNAVLMSASNKITDNTVAKHDVRYVPQAAMYLA
jgi:hypothetical protein